MDRFACVEIFSFRLQILLASQPLWLKEPVAVLDRECPQGRLLELSQQARSRGLRRGMAYGQALSLVPELRAQAVAEEVVRRQAGEIAESLGDFSPHVELSEEEPGLFWLQVSGLEGLYQDWQVWVEEVRKRLRQEHRVYIRVVLGFSRFGTFAVVRALERSGAFADRESEHEAVLGARLSRLGLSEATLEQLHRLGIKTIGELLKLPPEGARRRLGKEVYALYRQARGELDEPLKAFQKEEVPRERVDLEYEETNQERLLFLIKGQLHQLLKVLEERSEKLVALEMELHRRRFEPLWVEIRPAAATDDILLILDLVRLRLEGLDLGAGVIQVVLIARGERFRSDQLRLFVERPPRDVEAANRALARLRAEFGPQAVLQIIPRKGHLPEARFRLQELHQLRLPESPRLVSRRGIPRFYPTPIALSGPPEGLFAAGPHIISGGWWVREVHRDYYLAQLAQDRLLWVFYDRRRQRWYVHGEY